MNKDFESSEIIIRGLAHDLNNLLTVIMGNISLYQLYIDDKEKLNILITNSLSSCERAQEIIEQLNIIASLTTSTQETVSVIDLLNESRAYLAHKDGGRVEIINKCKSFITKANPNELKQAFQILILNSLQAIDDYQKLKIIIENIEFDKKNNDDIDAGYYIKIKIKDNGVGISEENQSKIFKKKFSTKESGSGLGLLICKSLIHRNYGYIDFQSTVNKGTTFNIYLHTSSSVIKDKSSESLEFNPELLSLLRNKRILVMDDEEKILDIISGILHAHKIYVDTATSKKDTITMYQTAFELFKPYDLVILDLFIMGEPDAIEVIQAIRNIDKNSRAILMSGSTTHPAILKYSQYGFNTFLSKPFYSDELLKNICDTIIEN